MKTSTTNTNNNKIINGGMVNMENRIVRSSVKTIVTEFAGKVIRTHKQLNMAIQKAISTVCEKPVVNKIIIDATVGLDGIGNTQVVRTVGTNSPMACAFEYRNTEMAVELEGYSLMIGGDTGYKATTDFVYISCKNCATNEQEALLNRVINFGLYKMGQTILFPEYKDGELVSLRIGSPYGKAMEGDVNQMINNPRVAFYVFFNASPSQERNADLVGIDARKYSKEARFELLDEMMGGSISSTVKYQLTDADINAIDNGMLSLSQLPDFRDNFTKKEVMKVPTRIAQQNTASMFLNTVGNDKYGVLMINTALTGGKDYNELVTEALEEEYGVVIDNEITDGQSIALEDIVLDAFNEHGVTVKRCAIRGAAFQMRTEGLNDKVFALFVSKRMMTRVVKTIIAKYGEDSITIVGNSSNIGYVVDSNACKLPNRWRMDRKLSEIYGVEYGNFKMAILAPASSSNANTSLQALGKVKCDEVLDAVNDNFYDMLGGSLERVLSGTLSTDNKAARAQKFFAANRDRSLASVSTQEMLVKELADQGISAIRKIKIPVSGLNLRALFDNTHLITGDDNLSVLRLADKKIQAYSKSVCDKFRRELAEIKVDYDMGIRDFTASKESGCIDAKTYADLCRQLKEQRTAAVDGIMTSHTVKYPCPTDIEFAVFRYLAWFEVEEAIDELACDDYAKDLLKELYGSLRDGIVMIAPLNTVKHRLAGMDTDYDGVTSFFEDTIVKSAIKNDNGDVVFIDKAEGDKSKSAYRPGATIQPESYITGEAIYEF